MEMPSGPDFVCIGPRKCATTWLADQLKLHRDLWLPPLQELGYLRSGFGKLRGSPHIEMHWDWWNLVKRVVRNKGLTARRDRHFFEVAQALAERPGPEIDLEGYRALFAAAEGRLTGDISPSYASMDVDRIREVAPVLGGARIFMIARDPLARFWSELSMHYRYRTFGELDYGSLETVQGFFDNPARRRQHFPTEILDRWEAALGKGSMKIFYFDDIAQAPEKTLRAIVDYIGGDYGKRVPLVRPSYNRKQSCAKVTVSDEAREWARQAFQPELLACAERFGRYGEAWLKAHRRPARDRVLGLSLSGKELAQPID
jgi:hypothetical protein